ncbi:hypothetical protein EXE43_13980 [Halorubrum sp. SS5]|nr:hypothetical protein EXE43_13980 [Halorubrum sp. SS5]
MFVFTVGAFSGLVAIYFGLNGHRIFFYPTVIIFFAFFTSSLIQRYGKDQAKLISTIDSRLLDIAILVGIIALVTVSRLQPIGLPISYYLMVTVVVFLLALRILLEPSTVAIIETVLLGVIIRASFWYAAPVIGRDTRLHLGIVRFVNETGSLVPAEVVYYHWYPIAHVLASSLSQITGLSPRVAQLWAITVPSVILLILFVGIVHQVMSRSKTAYIIGVLAILMVVVNPRHITRTGNPVPQSLSMTLLLVVLFLFVQRKDYAKAFILFLLTFVISTTHNFTPLFLITTILLLCFFEQFLSGIKYVSGNLTISYGPLTGIIGVIITVQYYIIASYFSLQVNRFVDILLLDQSIGQDVQTSTIVASGQLGLIDPLLHLGVDLFVYMFAIVVVGVLALIDSRGDTGDQFDLAWYSMASVMVVVIGGAVFISGSENTGRALGALSLITAPVLGYVVYQTSRIPAGVVFCILLVISFPLLTTVAADQGIRNPGMAQTERENDVQVYLTNEEIAAVDFIIRNGIRARSDAYVASTANLQSLHDGWGGPITSAGQISVLSSGNITASTRPFLFRTYMREYGNLTYPSDCLIFYDSGKAQLVGCPSG